MGFETAKCRSIQSLVFVHEVLVHILCLHQIKTHQTPAWSLNFPAVRSSKRKLFIHTQYVIHVRAGTIRLADTKAQPDRDALMIYGRLSTMYIILLDELAYEDFHRR